MWQVRKFSRNHSWWHLICWPSNCLCSQIKLRKQKGDTRLYKCTQKSWYIYYIGIFVWCSRHFWQQASALWVSSINISKLRSLTRVATLLCFQLSPIRQSVASRLWRCEKGHCVSLSRSTCYSDKQKIRAKHITIYWISFFPVNSEHLFV